MRPASGWVAPARQQIRFVTFGLSHFYFGETLGRISRWGVPYAETNPACARCNSGDGRLGGLRCAADTSAGIDGGRGELGAFVLEADTAAQWRKGAKVHREPLGGSSEPPETF